MSRPPASADYGLTLIRNQQVAGSDPVGGFTVLAGACLADTRGR